MNIKRTLSIICAAAMIISTAACRSSETAPANSGASSSSAEHTTASSDAEKTTSASSAQTSTTASVKTTTESSAETTTAAETTTYAETTTSALQTTVAETSASTSEVTYADTKAEDITTTEPEGPTVFDRKLTDEDIKVSIIHDGDVITENTDNITMQIEYIGEDKSVGFWTGVEYELEKYADGEWEKFPFAEEMAWISIAYELSSRSNVVLGISLRDDMYAEPVTAGNYRVVKYIGGETVYAPFEVTYFTAKDGEDALINKNGSVTLDISEITPDGFVCYNVYPLPGKYYVVCDPSEYSDLCVGDRIEVSYSEMYQTVDLDYRVIPSSISYSDFQLEPDVCYKPVIYLYPENPTQVSVCVDLNGRLTVTDPEYLDGWTVTAYPDGTLIHGGREYPYLFWEGEKDFSLDTSRGFCVSGADTERFLREKLSYLGLNESETAGFLGFWLPAMRKNPYNIITFAGTDYTENAKLEISPSPDTVIRVYMVFTPSEEYVDIPEQELEEAPDRNGFTVVEWGGSICG